MNRNSSKYSFLIGLFSPITGAMVLIPKLEWKRVSGLLVLFIGIFGATIILPESSDGYRLNQLVISHYEGLGFSRWLYELKEMILFSPEPGTKGDLFSHFWSYAIGGVLGVPRLNFFGISLIYGWLYISVLGAVLQGYRDAPKKSFLFWNLIFIFITYQFLDQLQFIRTPMGLFVTFLGVFGYYKTRKKKYIFVMFFAPLFHVAYFVMALPAYVVILIHRFNPKFFVILFALSFFIQINPTGILNQLKTTDLGESKVSGYYKEDPEDRGGKTGGSNWYVVYGKGWSKSKAPLILASAIIVFGLYSRKKMTNVEFGLFTTGLFTATIANLGDFVPAFYGRTMTNAGIYFTATAVLLAIRGELFQVSGKLRILKESLLWLSVIAFVPYITYVMANLLNFTSVYMLMLPVLGLFSDLNISLRELISYLI